MAPLIVLLVVTAASRLMGSLGVEYLASWPEALAVGLAAMFALTGMTHFVPATRRAGLVAIVPPRWKHPSALVTFTGMLEILGAVALVAPPERGGLRAMAAWGLAALLVAMFPANVYASRVPRHPHAPTTPLPWRTAMQCIFITAALLVALSS